MKNTSGNRRGAMPQAVWRGSQCKPRYGRGENPAPPVRRRRPSQGVRVRRSVAMSGSGEAMSDQTPPAQFSGLSANQPRPRRRRHNSSRNRYRCLKADLGPGRDCRSPGAHGVRRAEWPFPFHAGNRTLPAPRWAGMTEKPTGKRRLSAASGQW